MKIKLYLTVIFIFFSSLSIYTNIKPWPLLNGTIHYSPYISRYVDISNEIINIQPDNAFKNIEFNVIYQIEAKKSGKQIPLLFIASKIKSNFEVWVDDVPVKTKAIPENIRKLSGTPLSDFNYLQNKFNFWTRFSRKGAIKPLGVSSLVSDKRYFETNLSKGKHIIKVKYVVEALHEKAGLIRQKSITYILEPAKYWKSFKSLKINLDLTKCAGSIKSDLVGDYKKDGKIIFWHFNKLPQDSFKITYIPDINILQKGLMYITPWGIGIVSLIILFLIQFRIVKKYRKNEPYKKFSFAVYGYGFIFPLISVLILAFSLDITAFFLGSESVRVGFDELETYIMRLVFYPISLIIYFPVIILADSLIKKQ